MDLEKLVGERVEMTTYQNYQDDYAYITFALDDEEIELDRYYALYPYVPNDL